MRLHRRHLWLMAASVFVLATLPSIASSEPTPIDAVNEGLYEHHWSPSAETVVAGEVVPFRNLTAVRHGVNWINPPAPPECDSKVPVGTTEAASGTNWSGACKFTQPGTYTFYCTIHGSAMSGTVTVKNAGEPIAITEAATSVSGTGATLNGTVNPSEHATKYFFEWGTSGSYGEKTTIASAGSGAGDVPASFVLSDLVPGTLYHFRLVAENEKGTVDGADQTFITTGPPTATTGAAVAITRVEATLKGSVNPDGKSTKYFFEWGTSETYGNATGEVTAASDHINHLVSAKLTGLAPGTSYHFRLVAKNESESVNGEDRMFTTTSPSSEPPPSEPPPSEPPPTGTTSTTTPPPSTTPLLTPPPSKVQELLTPIVEGSLRLAAPRHGSTVRGSFGVSQAGAGGRLEVDLLAISASLARAHSKQVTVGRLLRNSVSAGKASFSVALTARGKSALRRHRRLALTVKVKLTPPAAAPTLLSRSIVLHA